MWPLNWIQIGGGALAAFGLAFLLHTVDIDRIESNQRDAIQEQIQSDNTACIKAKAITEGVANDQIKRINDLNSRLDKLNKLQPTRCITVPTANPTSGNHATTGDKGLPSTNGVTLGSLLTFGRDAEQVGITLDECQDFIRKERK